MAKQKFKAGDMVEYTCVGGTIKVKVLKVKADKNLILETGGGKELKAAGRKHTFRLIKNVCVKPHRVKKIK